MTIINFIKKLKEFLNYKIQTSGKLSYSQAGEDLILDLIFLNKKKGFYIDIGAYHPILSSNTYYFYKKGWRGINIDALSSTIKLFNRKRKNDINIEAGINDEEVEMKFYVFKNSSYNTFNSEIVNDILKVTELVSTKNIITKKLSSILSNYNIAEIDFISIDVEGLELNVLKSLDWRVYRPKVILVEDLSYSQGFNDNKVHLFLNSLNYIYFCKTVTNSFYLDKEFFIKRFNK